MVARHVAYIMYSSSVLALLIFGCLLNGYYSYQHSFSAYAAYTRATVASGGPTFSDPNLKVELVVKGLEFPTSMAFLGPDDILVLEQNTGTVVRIVDGDLVKKPLLHVGVTQGAEYGMLGIAIAKNTNNDGSRNVFLYYTESDNGGGSPHNRIIDFTNTN